MKMIKDIIVKEMFKAVAKEFISEVIKLIPEEYKLLFFSACLVFLALIFCFI